MYRLHQPKKKRRQQNTQPNSLAIKITSNLKMNKHSEAGQGRNASTPNQEEEERKMTSEQELSSAILDINDSMTKQNVITDNKFKDIER
ncbi:hypothetical protein JTB14_016846 [Gonioctena quinquepunctata]|nr:hypothetical protein JTB14_016846 [Gonioctena quinquepunctata]